MATALLNVYLINSGVLVFFRLVFYQGACFRVHKFLWPDIFQGSLISRISNGHHYPFYPRVYPWGKMPQ